MSSPKPKNLSRKLSLFRTKVCGIPVIFVNKVSTTSPWAPKELTKGDKYVKIGKKKK